MKDADLELLREAVVRNAGAVISLPSAGMLRHQKTRFLCGQESGFWVEAPAGEKPLIDSLIASAQPVGVSIKSSTTKIVFTTTLSEFRPAMRINRDTALDAVRMAWPSQIKAVQRRADYRAPVPLESDVRVRVWRIPEHHFLTDRPSASFEIPATLRDLSVSGMAVLCKGKADEPKLTTDQRMRVMLMWDEGKELIIEGRCRHVRPLENGEVRTGVNFKKLDDSIEGRQALATLTGIVGILQREEIRRARLTRSA